MTYIIFFISIVTATYLTTNNCPSNFNITTANATLQTSIDLNNFATSLYASYNTNDYAARIQNIVIKSDINDFNNYLYGISIPFIILAAFVFILYCILIACCLFDKSCPPCQSWRRDTNRRPYQKNQISVGTWFLFGFSIIIVVACMVIFSTIGNIKLAISNTKCSIYKIIDTSINGDVSNSWGGFLNISYQIGNISSNLSNSRNTITKYFGNNQFLITNIAYMQNYNIELYDKYINSSMISPDSATPKATITSQFIQNGLGPNQTSGTMISNIDKALSVTAKLSNSAYQLDQAAMLLHDSISTIVNNTALSKILFAIYINQLNNTIPLIQDFSSTYIDNYLEWIVYILETIIGFALIAAMLGILGTFSAFCFDVHSCRLIIHLSWLIFGLIYTGVIFLSFIFLPTGSIGTQFCGFAHKVLNNKTVYREFSNYYSQNVMGNLEICLFGNGNILNTFDAYSEMNTIFNLYTAYNTFNQMKNSSNNNYADTTIAYNTIKKWIVAIQYYRDGIYIDSNSSIKTNSNPNVALTALNSYSMGQVSIFNCTNDEWEFDQANCTSKQIYQAGNDPSTGLTIDVNSNWCYSFNSKLSNKNNYPWSQTDFTQRYMPLLQNINCSGLYNSIVISGLQLIQYRDSRIKLFQAIADDLTTLLNFDSQYISNISQFKSNVANFFNDISNLSSLVNDQFTGLDVTTNCTIIADNFRFFYNTFCINLMSQIVKIGICMIVLNIVIIGALITGNIIAIRYTKMAKIELLRGQESSINLQVKQLEKNSDQSQDD